MKVTKSGSGRHKKVVEHAVKAFGTEKIIKM
jgi:hypothetical protein